MSLARAFPLVLLAGCSDGGRDAAAAVENRTAEAPATARGGDRAEIAKLVVEGEGLRLFLDARARPLPFGSARELVMSARL